MNLRTRKPGGEAPSISAAPLPLAILSICIAIAVFLFAFGVIYLERRGIDPFQSMGNEKETWIGTTAAVLGMLLAVRALQYPSGKKTVGIAGLVLGFLALLAVAIFLPCI